MDQIPVTEGKDHYPHNHHSHPVLHLQYKVQNHVSEINKQRRLKSINMSLHIYIYIFSFSWMKEYDNIYVSTFYLVQTV